VVSFSFGRDGRAGGRWLEGWMGRWVGRRHSPDVAESLEEILRRILQSRHVERCAHGTK
jgi:hypothetical protein